MDVADKSKHDYCVFRVLMPANRLRANQIRFLQRSMHCYEIK